MQIIRGFLYGFYKVLGSGFRDSWLLSHESWSLELN